MRFLVCILIGLLYHPVNASQASNRVLKEAKVAEIAYSVAFLRPNIATELKKKVSRTIYALTTREGVDWRPFLAILFQESSLQLDPKIKGKRCKTRLTHCKDVGMGQVSMYYWGEKLKVDKFRALTDSNYSISLSFVVYMHYFKKYSKKEKYWYTRYHSGTPSLRKTYKKLIVGHYGKIVVAQRKFRRLRLYAKRQKNYYYPPAH